MGATVTVACKFWPGIIMRVFKNQEHRAPVSGGGMILESRSVADGEPIKINGPATPFGKAPKCTIIGGYALTQNVPEEVATVWMEQNKDSMLVKNNLIFVMPKADSAASKARELRDTRCGIEPLDVTTKRVNGRDLPRDPRWPAAVNPNLSGVRTDNRDEAA